MAKVKKETEPSNGVVNRISGLADSLPIPAISTPQLFVFRATGISPLLQNNPDKFIGKKEDDGIASKKVYNDAEEARLRLYLDVDGGHVHRTEAFLKAIVKAARGKKIGKAFAAALIESSTFVVEELSPLLDDDGEPIKDYSIHKKSVVVNKSRVLRCRPAFFPWSVEFVLETDTVVVDPERHLLPALQLAGRTVGVGDNRPEKGGPNGRFTAELVGQK